VFVEDHSLWWPEIDILIGDLSVTANDNNPAGAIVGVAAGPAISRPGDVWQIGSHRLICGDATKGETYQALLCDERAQMVFTDPPYNVPISGHVAARKQGDRVTQFDQFIDQPRDHPLCATVQLGRHAFGQGSDLSDTHEDLQK
jgi:hypothetical protein